MWRSLTLLILATLAVACSGSSERETPAAGASATVALEATPVPRATAVAPAPTPPPTPIVIGELPIIDMHFHPDAAWDLAALVALFDELGVKQGVGGSGGSADVSLDFWRMHPERFVPYAGQDAVRTIYLAEGAPSVNFQSERIVRHVAVLEEELDARCWAGIGELFVNTLGSHRSGAMRMPADSTLMRRLWQTSATYNVPLFVHMDADPASVAEMRRLLDSNPGGTWVWAHAGWYADPALLRELLQAHPNLLIELSFRDELRSFYAVSSGGRLREAWRALLEDLPERFMLGTDLLPPPTPAKYRELVTFWRSVLQQLTPQTAAKLAHENAERLLAGSRQVDPAQCR